MWISYYYHCTLYIYMYYTYSHLVHTSMKVNSMKLQPLIAILSKGNIKGKSVKHVLENIVQWLVNKAQYVYHVNV